MSCLKLAKLISGSMNKTSWHGIELKVVHLCLVLFGMGLTSEAQKKGATGPPLPGASSASACILDQLDHRSSTKVRGPYSIHQNRMKPARLNTIPIFCVFSEQCSVFVFFQMIVLVGLESAPRIPFGIESALTIHIVNSHSHYDWCHPKSLHMSTHFHLGSRCSRYQIALAILQSSRD